MSFICLVFSNLLSMNEEKPNAIQLILQEKINQLCCSDKKEKKPSLHKIIFQDQKFSVEKEVFDQFKLYKTQKSFEKNQGKCDFELSIQESAQSSLEKEKALSLFVKAKICKQWNITPFLQNQYILPSD